MAPSDLLCGMLVWIQSMMWITIKSRLPGFIHGKTSSEIAELVKNNVGDDWMCISLDGSAFDSTQNHWVMGLVDLKFWRGIK